MDAAAQCVASSLRPSADSSIGDVITSHSLPLLLLLLHSSYS
jgi:hypothetical protein